MRRTLLGISQVVLAALLAGAAPAAAEVVETVTGTVAPPAAGAQSTLRSVITITDTTGAKPPQLQGLTMRFPRGARVDARAASLCDLDRLERSGACPKSSQLGRGSAKVEVDFGPFETLTASIVVYNAAPFARGDDAGLVFHSEESLTGVALDFKGRIYTEPSGELVFTIPLEIPEILSVKPVPVRTDVTIGKRRTVRVLRRAQGRRARVARTISFVNNPPTCEGGLWYFSAEFEYEGGLRHSLRQGAPCHN